MLSIIFDVRIFWLVHYDIGEHGAHTRGGKIEKNVFRYPN